MSRSELNDGSARSADSLWFAVEWLRGSPGTAVRTVPVLAVVDELLTVLRDEQVPIQDAHRSLCRAVRLLSIFAAEATPRQQNQPYDERYERGVAGHVYSKEDLAAATESRRLADETLRGSLLQAIRTEPVITVVQELRDLLLADHPPRAVHTAVRRAVRLFNVYVADDRHRHGEHLAA